MPNLKSVTAVLPVTDHAAAVAWHKQWIGRDPDVEPQEGVAEWQIADNAWIQVSLDPETSGKTNIVIGVDDIDAHVASLQSAGVPTGEIQDFDFIKLTDIVDPAGNKVNFVWENPKYEPPAE
ncbi:VOC family protein [Micromonospora craniellae]|uniref:VOC family protein n=1 Tax=Micromonospora craniellae TaxID=2294034 RepID=A0A372FTB9_9ACTN|nr:VOC family protein [Micromonospora craniellae]QOC91740.1 VOC family protein [Micromonospora craniellae]RFS43760.1 VOC family protein [Micromonospora craniellae]